MKNTLGRMVAFGALLTGCQSGLYKVSTSEDDKTIDESVRYYEVERNSSSFAADFIKDNGASPDGILYDEERMPIEITEGRSDKEPDKPGLSGLLWMFSLGIFPMCQSEYMTQEITVKSPIGEKSGSYRVDAKRWAGWIPLFVGYPGSADERDSDAKLPNRRLEGIGKDRLVKNLVGEFSFKDYVAFARSKNGERKAEIARIKSVSEKVDGLLSMNKFDDAATFIDGESKSRSATQECDSKSWADMRERVTLAHQSYDKKHAQTLIATGKYEDAISFCDSKNSLSEEVNSELKNDAVKAAVKELKDADRLIAFLKLIKDIVMRDDVVMKLKSMNSLSQLPKDQLVEIANTTDRDGVVLAVIDVINDKNVLTAFLDKKRSANVLKVLLEKIADADAVRNKIWDGGNEAELCVYASVFGSDDECLKLIKAYPARLKDKVAKEFKAKVTKKEARDAIEELQTSRIAHEISRLEGTNLIARVYGIQDRDMRRKMALLIINEFRSGSRETVYPKIDAKELVGLSPEERLEKHRKFLFQQVAENRHRRAWSFGDYENALECAYLYGEKLEKKYKWLDAEERAIFAYLRLLRLISKEDMEKIATSIKTFAAGRISFEGFYIGMSVADYIILSRYSGYKPETNKYGSGCERIVFSRTLRYKMFEKEDGEFWSAFMHKYIPAGKKKSLGEAIGDALDNATYDYQEGYDDKLEERCYIYKSMKYSTKVLFGEKTGTLVLEEYK